MNKLRMYLSGLSPEERDAFATRCGTTMGYLRKAISVGQRLGETLCMHVERETHGEITCEALRPDVPWSVLRGTIPKLPASIAQAATESIAAEAAPVNALRAGRVRRLAERRMQRQRTDGDRRAIIGHPYQINVAGEA